MCLQSAVWPGGHMEFPFVLAEGCTPPRRRKGEVSGDRVVNHAERSNPPRINPTPYSLVRCRRNLGGAGTARLGEAGTGGPVLPGGWVRHPGLPPGRGGGHLGLLVPRAGEELVRARQRDSLQGTAVGWPGLLGPWGVGFDSFPLVGGSIHSSHQTYVGGADHSLKYLLKPTRHVLCGRLAHTCCFFFTT